MCRCVRVRVEYCEVLLMQCIANSSPLAKLIKTFSMTEFSHCDEATHPSSSKTFINHLIWSDITLHRENSLKFGRKVGPTRHSMSFSIYVFYVIPD